MAVAAPERERLRLELDGMTCASCAARIERKLNKLDGVEATVNYATEEASVSFDPAAVSVDDLIATVEAVGYHAALPTERVRRSGRSPRGAHEARRRPRRSPRRWPCWRWCAPLQFDGWEWLALALATPVVFWCGLAFHRATLLNARHLAATMDTLISVGTIAAWTWSTVVLVGGIDGAHLLRGGRGDHHADPARPLARAPGPRSLERGDPRPPRARRAGGTRAP